MISFLVAMGRDNVIGFAGGMPWHLPADLAFFKKKTTGHTIIMGRKTFESIGKPLPHRKNMILTSESADAFPDGVEVLHHLNALKGMNADNPTEELFVIGGGHIFKQLLSVADRMYITYIDENFKGDTFFPSYSGADWKLTSEILGEKNENNPYVYYFRQYDRKYKE